MCKPQWLHLSGLILALALILTGPARASEGEERARAAGADLFGTPAPAFVLKTIDGAEIDLGALYGRKAVYLKFWATWCIPCREQMPHLSATYERLGQDIEIVAVDTGFNDSLERIREYRKRMGLKVPIVMDDGRLAAAFHLRVTPQHVVINRSGRVSYVGHLASAELDAALESAREAPPADLPLAGLHAAPATAASTASSTATPTERSMNPASALEQSAAPDLLSVTALDGKQWVLGDPAGQAQTVLAFLSPWCESYYTRQQPERGVACKRETLATRDYRRHHPGARLLGISSGLWASAQDLAEFRDEKHLDYPLALDTSGQIFHHFGVNEVPAFIRIDAAGHVLGRARRLQDLVEQR